MPISEKLLAWYDAAALELPWRCRPGEIADPYRVWLSEIMLQQTTVAAVRPRFARFIERWPTVHALADAADADVMSEWAGLGYYARARNLLATARIVARDGFPDTAAGLRALPGIGAYTAAAIAAIALGDRAVVIDGNVERIVSRLMALDRAVAKVGPEIRAFMASATPVRRPGDFAQAMMDLGRLVCRPRDPECGVCPLAAACVARQQGATVRFPVRAGKAVKPARRATAFWIERANCVLLVRRPPQGLLGGMRALPSSGLGDDPVTALRPLNPLGAVEHVFTHFRLTLEVVRAIAPGVPELANGQIWWPIDRLTEAGLPTVFAKAARLGVQGSADVRQAA